MSRTRENDILNLRDKHSDYCWLYPASTTDAYTAADALLDRSVAFGAPTGLMSDCPTHSKNEIICLLVEGLRTPHHFTQPYGPWSNSTVYSLGTELLRGARTVFFQHQTQHDYWLQLVPLFHAALAMRRHPVERM